VIVGLIAAGTLSVALTALSHNRSARPASKVSVDEPSAMVAPYERRQDWPTSTERSSRMRVERPVSQLEEQAPTSHVRSPDSKARTAEMVARLKDSGPERAGLRAEVRDLFDNWKSALPEGSNIEVSDLTCFARGCATKVTYGSMQAFSQTSDDIFRSPPFEAWHGPKFRSGPHQDGSGRIEATWVLMN
jgi:hypothetical protein